MIKDQFMQKCKSQNLRTSLLRDPHEKLEQLISVARAHDKAYMQANIMKEETINHMSEMHHHSKSSKNSDFRPTNDAKAKFSSNAHQQK